MLFCDPQVLDSKRIVLASGSVGRQQMLKEIVKFCIFAYASGALSSKFFQSITIPICRKMCHVHHFKSNFCSNKSLLDYATNRIEKRNFKFIKFLEVIN